MLTAESNAASEKPGENQEMQRQWSSPFPHPYCMVLMVIDCLREIKLSTQCPYTYMI